MFDPEIEAIAKCHDLFKVLEDDSKIRVIQWLISKFELNPTPAAWSKTHYQQPNPNGNAIEKTLPASDDGTSNDEIIIIPSANKTVESYESVAECFSDASPNSDWEKALIVATYLQVKNGLADITSFEVNKELKNLGHASGNITEAFDANINRKPQFILQLRKDGKSQQARKKYKVSGEGIKHVNSMLQATK
jgi:hypothetical protein